MPMIPTINSFQQKHPQEIFTSQFIRAAAAAPRGIRRQ
jgi:hypothetical protein